MRPLRRGFGCLQTIKRCQGWNASGSKSSRLFLRTFYPSPRLAVIKPFLLSDIGEGIKEVQIIQWFVEPEARVEQFDKLCEVQSDKAAVEITSRFDGVIKKLHYEPEDMAQVGKPLCDIDVLSDIKPDDKAVLGSITEQAGTSTSPQQPQKAAEHYQGKSEEQDQLLILKRSDATNRHASLATPAVRGLLKELQVDISEVFGTGKDGRVIKEDVHRFAASRSTSSHASSRHQPSSADQTQTETPIVLNPIQSQMFKTMTRSLQIPHFVYSDELILTALSLLRARLNAHPATPDQPKLSYLPFIIKALSLALDDYPLLNARLETPNSPTTEEKPRLILRSQHNIGIAMDTPQGLLVPNIKSVNALSIPSIAREIQRLQSLALASKLSPRDLTGGTITVSNIGSIGGTYVSPVLVSNEVAILGIGKKKVVPAFDEGGAVVRREIMNFSWGADHRVVDGGTVARCAEVVRGLVEEPERMVVRLK